mgnify:CR=1 FL=1
MIGADEVVFPEREAAERTLIEIGARARGLLEERKNSGELLEERIRCERILLRIDGKAVKIDPPAREITAELGELPERLHEAGFAVEAPLFPGHGTTPADLRESHPEDWLEAALEKRAPNLTGGPGEPGANEPTEALHWAD